MFMKRKPVPNFSPVPIFKLNLKNKTSMRTKTWQCKDMFFVIPWNIWQTTYLIRDWSWQHEKCIVINLVFSTEFHFNNIKEVVWSKNLRKQIHRGTWLILYSQKHKEKILVSLVQHEAFFSFWFMHHVEGVELSYR